MKRPSIIALAIPASILAAGCATDRATSSAGSPVPGCCCAVPAGEATAVDARTADALRAALQDERRARQFYTNVVAVHGQVRPFVNIVNAEERHESIITSLMQRHGVDVPAAEPTDLPAVPETLRESSALAARLERENIAMYDRLLQDVKEPDIRAAFENLRAASRNNHLPAFERWSD
jgi:rubrerythrin